MDGWAGKTSVIRWQQRQKIGLAESNKEQLKDKPVQSKEKAIKEQATNESMSRFLKDGNYMCKGK